MRLFLIAAALPLALVLSCLGLETSKENFLGWFLVLTGVGYISGGAIYLWVKHGKDSSLLKEAGERSFWLILPGFLAVFYAPPLEYLYLAEVLPRNITMQILGLVLIGLGVLLRIWTRLTLKGMYTGQVQVLADHRLVQTGPYRGIRHPGYAAFLLIAFGLCVGFSSLVGLVSIPVLMLPGLVYRMKVEEALLQAQFGEGYRQYAENTKRLIPGIW